MLSTRLISTLNRVRDDAVTTAADLKKVLKNRPVKLSAFQLPRPPVPPKSGQEFYTLAKKTSAVDSASTLSPFSAHFSWRSMAPESKLKYKEMAVNDLLRYRDEYEEYKKIVKVQVTIEQMFDIIKFTQTEKRSKKQAKSGWRLFYQKFVEGLEGQKDLRIQDMSSLAAQAYAELSDQEKEEYRQEVERQLQQQAESNKPIT